VNECKPLTPGADGEGDSSGNQTSGDGDETGDETSGGGDGKGLTLVHFSAQTEPF
jgi:hypothetical protein